MSNKIKDVQIQEFIKRENLVKPVEHIVFSFKYLSNNSNYGKKAIDKEKIYAAFFDKMVHLSKISILKARENGKIQGCEPIGYSSFTSKAKAMLDNIEIIGKDSTLSVFRFGKQNYRMLCKTDDVHVNVLHVIGFDLDFTAYKH